MKDIKNSILLILRCIFLLIVVMWFATACTPPKIESAALGDIKPPLLKCTQIKSASEFELEFDEPIRVRENHFSAAPQRLSAEVSYGDEKVQIALQPIPMPGEPITLFGTVEDLCGNSTHIEVSFKGYNDRPAQLVLSEVQTAKNSSKKSPHRDYIELVVLKAGNLGGMIAQWASSTKRMRFDFPPCEVKANEVIVLHLQPEGIPEEKDEPDVDLALSGGIDATPTGRDFWCSAGGLPDESGVIAVYDRETSAPSDGFFYAESEKAGQIEGKLYSLVQELSDAGVWLTKIPRMEDALLWKPSTSRPFLRSSLSTHDVDAWSVGESSSQSPGVYFK